MKKIILFLCVISLAFVACKKEGCTDKSALNYNSETKTNNSLCKYPVPTGGLAVYVKNYLGNPVAGREVWLYTNETDFNNANYHKILTTNSEGKTQFNGLSSGVYWVDCEFYDIFGNPVLVEGNASVTDGYITTITIQP